MSENITTRKFNKGNTNTPSLIVCAAPEPSQMSNFARRSEMTKVDAVAEVSATIAVSDTSRQIKNLSVVFD